MNLKAVPALLLWLAATLLPAAEPPVDPLRDRARNGELPAMLELAGEYFRGEARPRNYAVAYYWYTRAAQAGSPEAKYNLGVMLEQGFGVERDSHAAYARFEQAAAAIPAAKLMQARYLLRGLPAVRGGAAALPADPERAERLLRELAAADYFPAQLELAHHLLGQPDPKLTPEELQSALAALEQAGAQKDAAALRRLGDCYYQGLGVPRDEERAFDYLRRAAELGDAEAHGKLGYCYEFGTGTPPDPARAAQHFKIAAEAGLPLARVKYGEYLLAGDYLEQNLPEAVRQFELATRDGALSGAYQLSRCYQAGWGVEPDPVRSLELLQLAARGNEVRALQELARRYARGDGVPPDEGAAAYWLKRAEEQLRKNAQ